MKTAIVLGLMVVILVGCASSQAVKPHRPEFYEVTKAEKREAVIAMVASAVVAYGAGIGGFVAAAAEANRLQQKALAVYPECGGMIEDPLWKCVREIDINEGRITADYVEAQRVDMDSVVTGGTNKTILELY